MHCSISTLQLAIYTVLGVCVRLSARARELASELCGAVIRCTHKRLELRLQNIFHNVYISESNDTIPLIWATVYIAKRLTHASPGLTKSD